MSETDKNKKEEDLKKEEGNSTDFAKEHPEADQMLKRCLVVGGTD